MTAPRPTPDLKQDSSWRAPTLVLFVVALLARLATAWHAPDPAYADSAYYIDAARALAGGHGFSVNAVWAFVDLGGKLPSVGVLPIPSFGHWAPLAALVQVPFIWLLGPSAFVSDLPFVLAGAAMAPLTWVLARDAGLPRSLALCAGLLVALPGAMLPFLGQADNFALYGLLAGLALWLTARALRDGGNVRLLAGAGLCAGLASLARTDGVLLAAALALAWLLARRRQALPWRGLFWAGALFALVLLPWEWRQLSTWGSLSPSTASGRVFFLRDIGEWNSLSVPATLDHLLSWGPGPLLASRLNAVAWVAGDVAVLMCGLLLAPFLVLGLGARWRAGVPGAWVFGPVGLYVTILLPFSILLATVHVAGGTFLHSATALLPFLAILELEGIGVAVRFLAKRRRTWSPPAAWRFFAAAAVAAMAGLSLFTVLVSQAGWDDEAAIERGVAVALSEYAAPAERVMAVDAASVLYWTGHPAVVLVSDAAPVVYQVAQTYDIRWLVLRRADSLTSSDDVLDGGARLAWIGPPVAIFAADGSSRDILGPETDTALFPLCLTAADGRCVP